MTTAAPPTSHSKQLQTVINTRSMRRRPGVVEVRVRALSARSVRAGRDREGRFVWSPVDGSVVNTLNPPLCPLLSRKRCAEERGCHCVPLRQARWLTTFHQTSEPALGG